MVFKESLHPCPLDESSLSIGRVKILDPNIFMLNFGTQFQDTGYSISPLEDKNN